jgi:phosphatidylethanolamine/phosphatidyl-N-methylethanolamine N-methyltransferase
VDALTLERWQRIAPTYGAVERFIERRVFGPWRARVWSLVRGSNVLEVGAGTGPNMPYYPSGVQVTATDVSAPRIERARQRAQHLGLQVELRVMDAQQLDFPAATFDAAVATLVFCSVPDPVQGLRELRRVVKPGGQVLLLEHVRIDRPVVGRLMDWLNPLTVRLSGENFNRRTVENVRRAGLEIERAHDLAPAGLVKLIVARPPSPPHLAQEGP